jgi:hypothetical protein
MGRHVLVASLLLLCARTSIQQGLLFDPNAALRASGSYETLKNIYRCASTVHSKSSSILPHCHSPVCKTKDAVTVVYQPSANQLAWQLGLALLLACCVDINECCKMHVIGWVGQFSPAARVRVEKTTHLTSQVCCD